MLGSIDENIIYLISLYKSEQKRYLYCKKNFDRFMFQSYKRLWHLSAELMILPFWWNNLFILTRTVAMNQTWNLTMAYWHDADNGVWCCLSWSDRIEKG
jgi:hypothetical protein